MLAGRLASRPRRRFVYASQQLEVTTEASLSSWACGSRASRRRDHGEDSDAQHRQANKPNPRQAFRYNTKASAAAALPEAEGKKTTATTKEEEEEEGGKVPESEPFCSSDHCSAFNAFSPLPPLSCCLHGQSSERTQWLTSVSSLAWLKSNSLENGRQKADILRLCAQKAAFH